VNNIPQNEHREKINNRTLFVILIVMFAALMPTISYAQSSPEPMELEPYLFLGTPIPSDKSNPYVPSVEQYRAPVTALAKSCNLNSYGAIIAKLEQQRRFIRFKKSENQNLLKLTGDKTFGKLADNADRALKLARIHSSNAIWYCLGGGLDEMILKLESICKHDQADQGLRRLQALVMAHKSRSDAVSALGTASKISPEKALAEYESAKVYLDLVLQDLTRTRAVRHECKPEEDKPEKKPARPKKELPSEVTPSTKPICYNPPEEIAASCNQWEPLLGRWTNAKYGGVIEIRLDGEDIIGAHIVSASKRMKDQGYTAGMDIMRGWRFGGVNAGTWEIYAKDGEAFSAIFPGREPGQVLGDPKWAKNGTLFINKKKPGVLWLPPALEGRISNYTRWTKQGSISEVY